MTALLLILFNDGLKLFIRKITSKRYYGIITSAKKTLENLNHNLNRAVRYHNVTKLLIDAFKSLFADLPHAFYILENDKYYLTHHLHINNSEIILSDFDQSALRNVEENRLSYRLDQLHLVAKKKQLYQSERLTTLLPFRGHNQIFAFLLIDRNAISFRNDQTTWNMFEKIQKKAGLVLENSALIIDLEKKNYETRKLFEVSKKILSSLDTKKILDFILSSLKTLINYDAAAIFLLDKSGKELLSLSSEGYPPGLNERLHLKMGQGAIGWVAQTRQIDLLDDVRKAKHYIEIRPETLSQISIPLVFNDYVLGVICLESNRLGYFKQSEADILQLFAHQAAIAIYNARQMDIILAKQAFEHELVNAGTVQKGLLVQQFPHIDDFAFTAINIPSKLVSGDLYDIIRDDETTAGIAIGDVTGKGAPAALMMTLILAGLRSQKISFMTVCDLVYRLNNLLYDSTIEGKYASFFLCVCSLKNNKLIYTNAGHNPPIFVKADGTIRKLEKGGIVLGFLANQEYIQEEVNFNGGDTVIAYTDGVTESMNRAGEEFGEERLMRLIKKHRHLTVIELKQKILDALEKFSDFQNPSDDITLLIFRNERNVT